MLDEKKSGRAPNRDKLRDEDDIPGLSDQVPREAPLAVASAPAPRQSYEKKSGRAHRATFATDKRKGGYIVRVEGPHATAFAGRRIPVTLKSGAEQDATLNTLIWSGKDLESGAPIALYSFVPDPSTYAREVDF